MGNVHDFSHVDILERYGRRLTGDPAATGDKTYGRAAEVEALAQILAASRSAVLLGSPGVGKTAVVRKLLHYLAARRLPVLQGKEVFEISTAGLCSDTGYTGEQESKIQALLGAAIVDRLIYIPDLWNLPGAGSYDTNPRGIYDLMRPGIEAGKLVLFGEMTPGRWVRLCREHPTLTRDFQPLPVAETDEAGTRDVLMSLAGDLAKGGLRFEKAAVDRAYSLARKFLPTQSFPGKGVDLLRKVAQAAARPDPGELGGTLPAARLASPPPIDAAFVEEVFGRQSGLPLHMISPRVRITYGEMRDFLAERVLGQAEAVGAVADMLALYKTGLKNPDRPAGVLLFVGPTGVGKTELAKATAEFLFGSPGRLFRVDVSEYKDYHSFEKLIGEPRAQKSGLLTDHVRQNPFTVVLLDEFEKGHPNLADLFLQVFDDGRLTDATGDTVDFRHALLILTSNVGSELQEAAAAIGFGDARESDPERAAGARARRALESHYRPEFLNRIDRILVFHPLSRLEMRRIAQRELGKLYRRDGLLERDLLLEVDEGVIDLLLERGFDPKYGARPLKRAIEELLVLPLARALLSTESRRFQLLRIGRKGGGVELAFEETESSRKLGNLERRTRVDDGEGKVVRLSLAEVREKLGEVDERLARLAARAHIDDMRVELDALVAREVRPGFWEEAFGKGGELYRRHRLAVEVRRFDDLCGRAKLIRELCEASFDEAEDSVAADLVSAYARLDRRLRRTEREILVFDEADRGDALVAIRPVGGKEGATEWAEALAKMYTGWAEERRYEVSRRGEAPAVELRVEGPYAYGYLRGEQGGHRLIAPPDGAGRDDKRGETYLARVEVHPLAGEPRRAPVRPRDDDPPIRTYDLWRSHGVRDRRTGHVDGDVRRVLAGRLDPFLEVLLDQSQHAHDDAAPGPPAEEGT